MGFIRRTTAAAALAVLIIVPAACDDDPAAPTPVEFVIDVNGETFIVRATDPATISALEDRRLSGERGVIMGDLASGAGGFNEPWSWHIEPGTIEVPDLAIELCDGTPSMVEADTDYWLNTVGRFCPWGALVVSRSN